MIITHVLNYFKVDLSGENIVAPAIDIDRTLLKRMQAGTCVHAQPPSVQYPPQFALGSSSSSTDSNSAILS